LRWGKSWNGPGDFPGCLNAEDGRNTVYFNTSPYPERNWKKWNPKYAAICQDHTNCISWRQTGGCDPYGPREPQFDKFCDANIPNGASGYCECSGGLKQMMKGCSKGEFRNCNDACKNDYTRHNTFEKMERKTPCDWKNMYEIESETKCKAAASQLGLRWGKSWNGPGDFPGCLNAEDGRNTVYFNTSPYPERNWKKWNPKYAAICQESPDKECCRQIFLKPPKQQLKIGGYYQFYRMYNGRPAYKLSGSRENWYLFYIQGSQNSVGRWVVYPQMMLNSSWKKFDISAEGNQKCPNEVGKQWISFWTWSGQSKLVDPNVDVICANSSVCTEGFSECKKTCDREYWTRNEYFARIQCKSYCTRKCA